MKEPKRLFDSGSPLERTILGYGRDEAPGGDLARKTLAAMAAAPAASAAENPTSWSRPRWIVGGAVALGLAAVVAGFVQRSERTEKVPPPAPHVVETTPPAIENVAPPARAETAPTTEVVVTPDTLPSAPARSATAAAPSAPPRAANPPAPVSSASIAREVELLDIVKAKLGAGDSFAATRALDAYDSEFPAGTLRPEATVLRVRTLLARGDRASAEKVGAEFLAKHPGGVHAKRVRALLSEANIGSGNGAREN